MKNKTKGKPGGIKAQIVPESFRRNILNRMRLTKEQILCLAGAVLLAGLSIAVPRTEALKDGKTIMRTEPGGADREYELRLGGLGDSDETISVRVSSREYTEEEAHIRFEALMEELAVHIVGSNENLDRIGTDLDFQKSISGYEGIRLSYYPADSGLIGYDGKVINRGLAGPEETYIRVVMKTGEYSGEYAVPVTVIPKEEESTEELKARLLGLIEAADREQITSGSLVLPESLEGLTVSYSEKKDHLAAKILLGGIFAAALVGLRPGQERRKRERERENELLIDYSEMVSRLIVYMGAGLTVRNAWLKLADSYESELKAGLCEKRVVYDEMVIAAGEIKTGVPEVNAYAGFARRCRQKCYIKLASILEQNLKNGDSRSEALLKAEMREAFEERKNIARRQGEEAGTKLMIPLMLSLTAVLVITAAPALLSFG